MTSIPTPRSDQRLVTRLEAHSIYAWPPEVVERTPGGWILRAMPGLTRGRSNHALTPCRPLDETEFESGVETARAFAEAHGIGLGLQVSPLDMHIAALNELAARGWDIQQAVQVLIAPTQGIAAQADPAFELLVNDHADEEWLRAWALCEPERAATRPGLDVESHINTVFPLMAGRARFCRYGDLAVGIGVDYDDILGLFCLAVAPHARRQGFGKALVRAIAAGSATSQVYLQVFSENQAGLALYNSLGFDEAYRYCHCVAPEQGQPATQPDGCSC